jgi:hypothetical protein
VTRTEEPQQIKDLRAKVAKVEASVEKRRQSLHVDDVLVFKSSQEKFRDRPPLRFRKLRFAEAMQILTILPKIEPTIAVDEKTSEKVETWPELTPEEALEYFAGACQGLATSSLDGKLSSDFKDWEPSLVVEAFHWLFNESGYSAAAVEDFEWFRGQTGRATSR